jgi:hypothetical protein
MSVWLEPHDSFLTRDQTHEYWHLRATPLMAIRLKIELSVKSPCLLGLLSPPITSFSGIHEVMKFY